jgi:hypothetical protein
LYLAKKEKKIKIGQRKFKLDWEQIGDIYEGFFSPEIHNGYIITYIHTEIFRNKQQVFCE